MQRSNLQLHRPNNDQRHDLDRKMQRYSSILKQVKIHKVKTLTGILTNLYKTVMNAWFWLVETAQQQLSVLKRGNANFDLQGQLWLVKWAVYYSSSSCEQQCVCRRRGCRFRTTFLGPQQVSRLPERIPDWFPTWSVSSKVNSDLYLCNDCRQIIWILHKCFVLWWGTLR